jgi:hypothetical protein
MRAQDGPWLITAELAMAREEYGLDQLPPTHARLIAIDDPGVLAGSCTRDRRPEFGIMSLGRTAVCPGAASDAVRGYRSGRPLGAAWHALRDRSGARGTTEDLNSCFGGKAADAAGGGASVAGSVLCGQTGASSVFQCAGVHRFADGPGHLH